MYVIAYIALDREDGPGLVESLEGLGYKVRRLPPDETLSVRVAAVRPDVVVLDLRGPLGSAPAYIQQLREQTEVPILVVRDELVPFPLVAACLTGQDGAEDILDANSDHLEIGTRVSLLGRLSRERRRTSERLLRLEAEGAELRKLSVLDPLTELYNRRHLGHLMSLEIKRAKRYGLDMSCLMIDVDHFKRVNDRYGHDVGDHALKRVAHSLTIATRDVDVVARHGGEEFCIMLPNTPLCDALDVAERARSYVEGLTLLSPEGPYRVTISIGVAAHVPDLTPDVDALLRVADKALYRAKETGRNRVCYEGQIMTPRLAMAT